MNNKFTPGPWLRMNTADIFTGLGAPRADGTAAPSDDGWMVADCDAGSLPLDEIRANAQLIASAPELLEALHEGRRAIGDHYAPHDCYATGPLTGDPIRDLVECPACSFIEMYGRVVAKATGEQP